MSDTTSRPGNQTSLLDLPVELVEAIGRFATDKSLYAMCLTSCQLKQTLTPILYNSVKIIAMRADHHFFPDLSADTLDLFLNEKTNDTIQSITKYREYIKRLHIGLTDIPCTAGLEASLHRHRSMVSAERLVIERIQSALSSEGRIRPTEELPNRYVLPGNMSYRASYGNDGYPFFGTNDRIFTWLKPRVLEIFKAEKYILCTSDRSLTSKDTVTVIPFVHIVPPSTTGNIGVHPVAEDGEESEGDKTCLMDYLARTQDPMIMGYLPQNVKRPISWSDERHVTASGHSVAATCTLIDWYDWARQHHGDEHLESLMHSVVKPITFVGSTEGEEEGSSRLEREMEESSRDRPSNLPHLISYEDWCFHPALTHELGIDCVEGLV